MAFCKAAIQKVNTVAVPLAGNVRSCGDMKPILRPPQHLLQSLFCDILTERFVVKLNINILKGEQKMIQLDNIKTEIPALQATLTEVGDSL